MGAPMIRDTMITEDDEDNSSNDDDFNGDDYNYRLWHSPFGGSTFGLITWDYC
jgi:spore coat protein CotH